MCFLTVPDLQTVTSEQGKGPAWKSNQAATSVLALGGIACHQPPLPGLMYGAASIFCNLYLRVVCPDRSSARTFYTYSGRWRTCLLESM